MKLYKKFINNNGFTMIEALFALSICSICILLLCSIASILLKLNIDFRNNDDSIAIYQLRLLLIVSYDFHIDDNQLHYVYAQQEEMLYFHNQRLVRQGGYEIFLQKIDAVKFEKENGCIRLYWKRKDIWKDVLLVCE